MKSYIIAWIIGLATVLLTGQPANATPRRIKGSGKLVTKEQAIDSFSGLRVSRAIQANLVEGTSGTLTIEADDNLIDYVVARVEKGVLLLTIDSNIHSLSSCHVTITVPTDGALHKINASSAAKVRCEPQIVYNEVDLSASSAASIEATVKAETCEIDLSSSASMTLEVRCNDCSIEGSSAAELTATIASRNCEIDLSSAAVATLKGASLKAEAECTSAAGLNATHFAVKRYDVDVSSAGNAQICCIEELTADASSGGSIRYTGGGICQAKSSSGGSIRTF